MFALTVVMQTAQFGPKMYNVKRDL